MRPAKGDAHGARRWSELSPRQRRLTVAVGTAQVVLQVAALADLYRRDRTAVNGPKSMWVALSFVNFLGPIAYFVLGRRRAPVRPAP